jgi:hypothetical protein
MTPIDLYLKGRAVEYFAKNNINNELTDKYLRHNNIEMSLIMKPTDVRVLPHFASRNPIQIIGQTEDRYKVIIAVKKSQQSFGSAFGITEENVLIYTKKLKIANYCTAFQGLLVTINMAFDYILKNNRYSETTVIVKSESVIKAIKNSNSTHHIISRIFANLLKIQETGRVVKVMPFEDTYHDIYRRVLTSAGEAANSHNRIIFDSIPESSIKKTIRETDMNEWDRRWQESAKGRKTHQFIPTVKYRREIKRHFMTEYYVTQAITGHNNCNEYLFRFKIKDTELCHTCPTNNDDVKHRLYECTRFEEERQNLRTAIEMTGRNWPLEQKDCLNKDIFNYF